MKEILPKIFKLETPTERLEFLDNLFATDLFKAFFKSSHPMVLTIKESFSKYPRYYYTMQDKDLERAAFTSWYNVLSLKTYQNPYIQDLYYFHELIHISTMPYLPELNFTDWQIKMRSNEVLASMNSEVLIYFYIPEYRAHTFTEEIWVDRFLSNPYYQHLAKTNLTQLAIDLTSKRTESYLQPKDAVEQVLAKFRAFSHLFYNVWKNRYSEMENSVNEVFQNNEGAHEEFLKQNMSAKGIMFEAEVNEHYQNYVTKNNQRPHY